jgi:TrpR family trp operon transcriptional repressor
MSEKDGWRLFLELVNKVRSPKQLEKLLEVFMTGSERKMLGQRYLIIQALLKDQLTQLKIAERLDVSIPQITRGSNALKLADPETKDYLKKEM